MMGGVCLEVHVLVHLGRGVGWWPVCHYWWVEEKRESCDMSCERSWIVKGVESHDVTCIYNHNGLNLIGFEKKHTKGLHVHVKLCISVKLFIHVMYTVHVLYI